MADLGVLHVVQGLQGLFHAGLTVGAHHAFNFHGFFHGWFLLWNIKCNGVNGFILTPVVDPNQIQTESIGDNAEAGQAHGSCPEHRVQRQPQGDEHPSSQGDANGVIEEGPEQVLVDVPQGSPAETNGRRHIAEPALHQHHIGRVNGHVRAGADGDAQVCPGEGRGIVDAVSHHGDLPLFLQLANDPFLPVREDPCDDLVHPRLAADGLGSTPVVPREHHHLNAHGLEFSDGLGAVLLDDIRHSNDARQPISLAEKEGRFPGLCQPCSLGFHLGQPGGVKADKVCVPAPQGLPLPDGRKAVARKGLEIRYLLGRQAPRLGLLEDGPGQGVLTLLLQRKCQAEQRLLCKPRCWQHIGHLGLPRRNGARLVQNHNLGPASVLQGNGTFE